MIVPPAPLFAIVRDFKANAIGIRKEDRAVVRRVFRVKLRGRTFHPKFLKPPRNRMHCPGVFHAKTEMMKPGTKRIVGEHSFRRPQHESEVAIIILNVGISIIQKTILQKAKRRHDSVVEGFRTSKIAYGHVNVINADDFNTHLFDTPGKCVLIIINLTALSS